MSDIKSNNGLYISLLVTPHFSFCLILVAIKLNHFSLVKLKASELNGNSVLTIGTIKDKLWLQNHDVFE